MSGKTILSRERYEQLLKPLTKELSAAARWIQETGQRVIIVFEGRDTAGKGGSIDMISQNINPRHCKVVALSSPTEREKGQWYFQRYLEHLPAKGELVLFDRSWYNRAGVEKVMGFCSEDEVAAFLEVAPQVERQIVEDGILLYKYWLCVDQERQEERFFNRLRNPRRRWKLSEIDLASRAKYDDYSEAREAMLKATHTEWAPWVLVDFNDQPVGRLTLLRDFLDRLPDTELPTPEIPWPDLPHPPSEERFEVIRPIPNFDVGEPQ
jgi:polyphosphate kinase 2